MLILLATICSILMPVLSALLSELAKENMTRFGGALLVFGLLIQIQCLKARQILYPSTIDFSRDDTLKKQDADKLEQHERAGNFFIVIGTILSIFSEWLV